MKKFKNPYWNKVFVNFAFAGLMLLVFITDWIRGVEDSGSGGLYGIVTGILFMNAFEWWGKGDDLLRKGKREYVMRSV